MPRTARQKRYEDRLARNAVVVPVEIDHDDVKVLIDEDLIDEDRSDDRGEIATALKRLLQSLRGERR